MFDPRISRGFRFGALAALLMLVLAACSTTNDEGGGGGGGGGKKIALLLPELKTTRYEAQDRPLFEAKVKALCSDCQILYSNADQDAAKQQSQAEAALTNGANVMVLDPVDSASAASIVANARTRNVPVISYDRLITNADLDYYISFDNEKVGKLQGTSLVDKLKADGKGSGTIVMINGAPTDNNATLFKKGAHSVIDGSGLKVGKEYDTPDWSPDKAQSEMEAAITALGKTGFVGVYAANDGTGGGAIAAMKGQGLNPAGIPVTGQDAELAAVQRLLTGEQYMTVYKAIKPEAEAAAQLAVDLLNKQTPAAGLVNGKVNNGKEDVPSVLLEPVAVTKDNVKDTIVKDGFLKPEQICTGPAASACAAAGIST
ncbi:MAG TPA: sugar ABC transporter substrate-binding protein [Actinomycetes bacterium]|nr:sugar ABC transporter substrate-binding protein [Actinomycetes bacterium]